jgi:hypothetical protein
MLKTDLTLDEFDTFHGSFAALGPISHLVSSYSVMCMVLLAFQFGMQPILAREFNSAGVLKTTLVLSIEVGGILLISFAPPCAWRRVYANPSSSSWVSPSGMLFHNFATNPVWRKAVER